MEISTPSVGIFHNGSIQVGQQRVEDEDWLNLGGIFGYTIFIGDSKFTESTF